MRVRPYEMLLVTSLIGLGDGSGQTNLDMDKSRSVLIVHDLCWLRFNRLMYTTLQKKILHIYKANVTTIVV